MAENEETEALLSKSGHEQQSLVQSGGKPSGINGYESGQSSTGENAKGIETQVYTRRWYILLVFSLMSLAQGAVWNTWAPITRTSETVFNWQDSDIALLSNWGPITYVISMAGFAWLLDVKGLRISSLVCAALIAVGSGLRCITVDQPAAGWLIHAGQILNGFGGPISLAALPTLSSNWFPRSERITATALTVIANDVGYGLSFVLGTYKNLTSMLIHTGHILNGFAGPISMAACPTLSIVWFPPNQRATATAISAVFNYVGMAISFIIGPLLVREAPDANNGTNTTLEPLLGSAGNVTIEDMKHDISVLMYIEFGYMALVFLAMLVYFPAKPPKPPSNSAEKERVDFKKGLIGLFKMKNFWFVAIPYGISTGVYGGWGSVLGLNLSDLHITQTEAGWIGFYSAIAGCAAGFIIARVADFFAGHIKLFLLALTLMGVGSSVWVTIVIGHYIPFSTVQLYASCILVGFFLNGTIPLFYEMSCETSFPIAEGVTGGLLTFLNNVIALVFLLVFMIPNVGTMWMNWFLVGCVSFCFLVLLLLQENYKRLELDSTTFFVEVHKD